MDLGAEVTVLGLIEWQKAQPHHRIFCHLTIGASGDSLMTTLRRFLGAFTLALVAVFGALGTTGYFSFYFSNYSYSILDSCGGY